MLVKKIIIENILSIEKATVEFDHNGLILLEGYNHDNDRSNGSGKTAIFNAMSFAIYDKLPRKITKTEIKRFGTKKASAYCEISVNNDVYSVKRCRPSGVEYFKNNEKIDVQQDEFEKKIGLTYDQFLITMYTAQGEYDKRFLSLNDKGKKDFILELMKLDKFTSYFKRCKDLVKDMDNGNNVLDAELRGLKYNVDTLKESMEDENGINEIISSNNSQIKKLLTHAGELSKIRRPDVGKYEEIREKARRERERIGGFKAEKSRLTSDLITLDRSKKNQNFTSNNECPNCNKPLFNINGSLVKHDDVKKIEEERDIFNAKVDEDIQATREKINSLDVKILKENDIDKLLTVVGNQQTKDTQEYSDAIIAITDANNSVKLFQNSNETLQFKLDNNSKLKTRLADILGKASNLSTKIKSNNEEKLLIGAVGNIFATTGAPAHIMEDFVANFNDMIQGNIETIWSNASYSLQTKKVNSDKKVTAKFSESLIINGKEISIGSLSGGERRSLSLAADFAILDILKRQFGMNISPIILDEPFDGLDSVGRETVIELLKGLSKDREIWVIDHASEAKTLFSKIVKIEKKNGISSLI